MEVFAEAVSVIGALVLSVACGLLLEELIFGGLVRLFFAPQPGRRAATERNTNPQPSNGDRPCSL